MEMLCVSDPELFQIAAQTAIEFIYEYMNFAALIDNTGLVVNFEWIEGQGYCTDDIPNQGTAS